MERLRIGRQQLHPPSGTEHVDTVSENPQPFALRFVAEALTWWARTLVGAGRPADAKAKVDEAVGLYRGLDAAPAYIERAERAVDGPPF
jgi:hypothetical protein